jgi:hypothetical protein
VQGAKRGSGAQRSDAAAAGECERSRAISRDPTTGACRLGMARGSSGSDSAADGLVGRRRRAAEHEEDPTSLDCAAVRPWILMVISLHFIRVRLAAVSR